MLLVRLRRLMDGSDGAFRQISFIRAVSALPWSADTALSRLFEGMIHLSDDPTCKDHPPASDFRGLVPSVGCTSPSIDASVSQNDAIPLNLDQGLRSDRAWIL
jgi:hypothetical protein